MKRLPFLATALSAALALASGLVSASAVTLTTVSTDPYTNNTSYHATEVEPDTFSNGSTIVSAFQQGRFQDGGASNIGWATSTDGGSTWAHGSLPGITKVDSQANPYARDTDAAVAYDSLHGTWLIVSLPLNVTRRGAIVGAAVIVNRSTTGTSWDSPVTVAAATGSQDFDKTWIACDNNTASPYRGNCYAQWDDHGHRNQLHMAVSSDGGLTWKQSTVPRSVIIGGQPVAQPNGTVVVPIDNGNETAAESFVSTDGGVTYTGPYSISNITDHAEAGSLRSGPLPTAEVDASGTVYVAWSDCRFITNCTANDIIFSTSTDGKTWSTVQRVPIDATTSGVDHFLPGLAVDSATSGSTAALGLTYYYYPNTSCSTSTCSLDVGFIGSSTGGATWGTATQLAGPSSLDELPNTSQGYMVGDYISSSFVSGTSGDVALSVFAVGMTVTNRTCTLGDVTSCNEPMQAPASGLTASSAVVAAAAGPVVSNQSDHAAPQSEVARR